MAEDRDPVDLRDVDAVAGLAGRVGAVLASAADEPGDRGVKPGARQELERCEDPSVDEPRLDVAAAAGVDLDVRIGQIRSVSCCLDISSTSPIDGFFAPEP